MNHITLCQKESRLRLLLIVSVIDLCAAVDNLVGHKVVRRGECCIRRLPIGTLMNAHKLSQTIVEIRSLNTSWTAIEALPCFHAFGS